MDELTESARQCLVSQGIVIGILSVLDSVCLFLTGLVVLIQASDILRFTSLIHLAILETVCGLFSALAVTYVCQSVSGYRNRHLEIRLKYLDERLSRGLVSITFVIIISFSALVVSAIFLMLKTDTSSTYELKSTMSLYAVDCTRKIIMDRLQISFQCCGSVSFLDWFPIDWQNSDVDGQNLTFTDRDSVPFSCCNLEIAPPCIHHQLRAFGVGSIYSAGCANKLDEAVFYFVLASLVMFFVSTFIMIFLLYISRKLQTSARSAILKGDSTAPGIWWLLSRTESDSRGVEECCMPLLEKPRLKHSKREQVLPMEKAERNPFMRSPKKRLSTEIEEVESFRSEKSDSKIFYGDSSEDWTRMANNASETSSMSSFLTSTVPINSTSETRHSVSDTAVANLEVSHHLEHKVRPLYRS